MHRQVAVVILLASLSCVPVHALNLFKDPFERDTSILEQAKDVVTGKRDVKVNFKDGISTGNTDEENLAIVGFVAIGIGILLACICCGVCCKYCCCSKKPPTVIMYQEMPPRNQRTTTNSTVASGGIIMPMVHRHNGFAEMHNQPSSDITPPPPYPGFKV